MNLNRLTILLLILAVLLRSELFFALLYIVAGLQAATWLWMRYGTRHLSWQRHAPAAAFPGERLAIGIEVRNGGLLPLPWLALHESLPPALSATQVREVLSLGAGERRTLSYEIQTRRRGYYKLGPLTLSTGDVLGLAEQPLRGQAPDALTIYPPILPLSELGLPASLPYGTLATPRRLFDDPTRPAGTRPYQAADGVRRMDWKSSAHAGSALVRQYQPAIALETLVALAFSREEYGSRFAYDLMERGLVAAASIVADLAARRQSFGLCTSGYDPAAEAGQIVLPVASGRAHFMAVLGTLGRLEPADTGSVLALLHSAAVRLGWGSTVVVVAGQVGADMLPELVALRRRGLNVALVLADAAPGELQLARQQGIACYSLQRDGLPHSV
ncbi:MAG TPA: DUF58 domain-containing protein [Roseiflexaceae bacterium]|nr:DUF58 domain-containing protein [Roseiflexaceae bacterium]